MNLPIMVISHKWDDTMTPVASCVWLLSLSIVFSWFIHVVACNSPPLLAAPGQWIGPRAASSSREAGEPSAPRHPPKSISSSKQLQQDLCPGPQEACRLIPSLHTLKRWTTKVPGHMEQLKDMSLLNMVHWRREWQTTSLFLP